ncbi:hypothetical protein ABW19_dt0202042 [Dactylella cylindrospora]|nr:hypothetical protein ABW19_dt0202042 [Dactylella cylindrospora]
MREKAKTETINILIIGPSQNGKSTFINKVRGLCVETEQEAALTGDGTGSCTKVCTEYNLRFPRTKYGLVDKVTREDISISEDNELEFFSKYWRKRTSRDTEIYPLEESPSYINLRIIDTPGLDDSDGADDNNIAQVMQHLHKMGQSGGDSNYISAILFTVSTATSFSSGLQSMYKYYERCMPNLFGGVAVVNTNFSVERWKQAYNKMNKPTSHGHLGRLRSSIQTDPAKVATMRQRRQDFYELFGRDARHFFIDSKPSDVLISEDLTTRNQICDIITYLSYQKPMPITNMKLVKSPAMTQTDKKLIEWLREAKSKLEQREKELFELSDEAQKQEAIDTKKISRLEAEIEQLNIELALYDNDSPFTLNTYSTAPKHQMSIPQAIWNTIRFAPIEDTLVIRQDEHPGFLVDEKHEGPWAQWGSTQYNAERTEWRGQYKASPGHVPNLEAVAYTTNRKLHQVLIRGHEEGIRSRKTDIEITRLSQKISRSYNSLRPINPALREVAELLPGCDSLIEALSAEWAPIESGFNTAARERYAKPTDDVNLEDLYKMVESSSFKSLEGKLRELGLSEL